VKDFKIIMTDEKYNPNDHSTYVAIQLTKLTGTTYLVKDKNGYIKTDKNGNGIEDNGYEFLFCKDDGKYLPSIILYKGEPITINPNNGQPIDIKQYNILSSSDIGTVKADLVDLINDKNFVKINGITMVSKDEYYKIKFNYETHTNKDLLYTKQPTKEEIKTYGPDVNKSLSIRIPINKFKKWKE
jgi:hypothetical protein